ncbi:MAG: phosphate ABC transporter ATP-binding protein PstB [Candidatus Anammoxibacter sp.]
MESTILTIDNFYAYYGDACILKGVSLNIPKYKVTAIMGPSGCGKTTFIRCINRMHELTTGAKISGDIRLNDESIYSLNPSILRRKIGMVFQRPNPFPTMSIYDNVIAGYKLNGIKINKNDLNNIVEESLKKAALWNEVKDNLFKKGTFLSGGQQQRLCIARALAMNPEILLLDEPTSALDPKSTACIEELIVDLKKSVTIIIVTHNTTQAARTASYTAFLYLGELIEFGRTEKLFTVPDDKRTEEYLIGRENFAKD